MRCCVTGVDLAPERARNQCDTIVPWTYNSRSFSVPMPLVVDDRRIAALCSNLLSGEVSR